MKGKLIGLLGPVVSGLGYELVEIEWSAAGSQLAAAHYIDRTDGAAVEARRLRAREPVGRRGARGRGPDRSRVPARGLFARL